MSIKLLSHKGMTLMETILASVIIIVMLFGISTTQLAMQNNSQMMGGANLDMWTATSLVDMIIADARKAVGTNSTTDKGILTVADVNDRYHPTFCIHFKKPVINVPGSFTDHWACYTQIDKDIVRCEKAYDNTLLRGAGACETQPGEGQGHAYGVQKKLQLTAGVASALISSANDSGSIKDNPSFAMSGPDKLLFTIKIYACRDATKACVIPSGGVPVYDAAHNYIQLKTGSVFPPEHTCSLCED